MRKVCQEDRNCFQVLSLIDNFKTSRHKICSPHSVVPDALNVGGRLSLGTLSKRIGEKETGNSRHSWMLDLGICLHSMLWWLNC